MTALLAAVLVAEIVTTPPAWTLTGKWSQDAGLQARRDRDGLGRVPSSTVMDIRAGCSQSTP